MTHDRASVVGDGVELSGDKIRAPELARGEPDEHAWRPDLLRIGEQHEIDVLLEQLESKLEVTSVVRQVRQAEHDEVSAGDGAGPAGRPTPPRP